eukprot:902683-Amphidinium_carterae.1
MSWSSIEFIEQCRPQALTTLKMSWRLRIRCLPLLSAQRCCIGHRARALGLAESSGHICGYELCMKRMSCSTHRVPARLPSKGVAHHLNIGITVSTE